MVLSIIKKFVRKFFGLDRFEFDKVVIHSEVLDAISEFARTTHPKEFIMFLEGKNTNKVLKIKSLYFQQYYANEDSAMPIIHLPIFSSIVGSVHSHPGGSNRPSRADLHFFQKHGMVHLIIKMPYRHIDVACYDSYGRQLPFMVEISKK